MPEQVGRDHRVAAGERVEHRQPGAVVAAETVQQQQGRPLARPSRTPVDARGWSRTARGAGASAGRPPGRGCRARVLRDSTRRTRVVGRGNPVFTAGFSVVGHVVTPSEAVTRVEHVSAAPAGTRRRRRAPDGSSRERAADGAAPFDRRAQLRRDVADAHRHAVVRRADGREPVLGRARSSRPASRASSTGSAWATTTPSPATPRPPSSAPPRAA